MATSIADGGSGNFETLIDDSMRQFNPDLVGLLKAEQLECLRNLFHSRDVVGFLPTGFGKSIIYQVLPSLIRLRDQTDRGTTLVISPLNVIHLDQLNAMADKGKKIAPFFGHK